MKRSLLALALGAALSGCYTTKYVYSDEKPGNDVHHVWQHGLIQGLVTLGETDLSKVCGDKGVYRIKSQIGGLGLLGFYFTMGIWTPMHVKVVCAEQ